MPCLQIIRDKNSPAYVHQKCKLVHNSNVVQVLHFWYIFRGGRFICWDLPVRTEERNAHVKKTGQFLLVPLQYYTGWFVYQKDKSLQGIFIMLIQPHSHKEKIKLFIKHCWSKLEYLNIRFLKEYFLLILKSKTSSLELFLPSNKYIWRSLSKL